MYCKAHSGTHVCCPSAQNRCIEGADVRKSTLSNKTATVDAYLRITLGKHKRAPTKTSKVCMTPGHHNWLSIWMS